MITWCLIVWVLMGVLSSILYLGWILYEFRQLDLGDILAGILLSVSGMVGFLYSLFIFEEVYGRRIILKLKDKK